MAHARLVPLCTADIEGEVQRSRAHLHSFVIPQETKCSHRRIHDRVTHSRVRYIQNAQKKGGVEEMAVGEWHQLGTSIM